MRRFAPGRQWFPCLAILLVSVGAVLPSLLSELLLAGHDAKHHVRWLHFFAEQFWQGTLYPRWLPEMNAGFGSPVFFIYPPLPYFVTALLHPFAPDPAAAPYRLAAGIALSLFVGGMGTFCWMRELVSRRNALLSAILFILLPYHLLIDVYLRVAYAELWALAWAPWALFAIHRFDRNPPLYGILCAASLAALALSHAPSIPLLVPAILAYGLSVALIKRQLLPIGITIGAVILSFPLCAAYLATALNHGELINQAALFDGRHHYSRWLLFGAEPWPSEETWRMILATVFAQGGMTVLFGLVLLSGPTSLRRWGWTPLLLAAGSLFLMTTWSDPVWRLFPVLQKVQFPWRFLIVQTVALTALAGLALEACARRPARIAAWMRPAVHFGLVGLALVNVALLPPIAANREAISTESVFALPRGPKEYVLGDLDKLRQLFPRRSRALVTAGEGRVAVRDWRSRRVALEIDARTTVTVAVRQFHYTGWRYVSDNGVAKAADALVRLGVVGLKLPPGRHHVELTLTPTGEERFGRMASLLSVAALIVAAFFSAKRSRRIPSWANARPPA
ncbi:hypothetical protein [Rhodospirillaceae bacterium SYSU D60014]|uniref:hypothetical protein n=1 Tax=Virgifigura deserti TaxID=2268457 RepID=UPI000E6692C3